MIHDEIQKHIESRGFICKVKPHALSYTVLTSNGTVDTLSLYKYTFSPKLSAVEIANMILSDLKTQRILEQVSGSPYVIIGEPKDGFSPTSILCAYGFGELL